MSDHFDALAAGIREDAKDRQEERGPWAGVSQTCRVCGRETVQALEDGECPSCQNDAEMQYEFGRQREEAAPRFRNVAARWRAEGRPEDADALELVARKWEAGK